MYTVIHDFCDMTDKKHVYRVGDKFPHSGINVSEDRIKELSSKDNRQGTQLIRKVKTRKKKAKE